VNPTRRLRDACARITPGDGGQGTGYLVAPDRVATAGHVVRSLEAGGSIELTLGGSPLTATLVARDPDADVAILGLGVAVTDVAPLTLAGKCLGKAEWESFGFVASVNAAGLPLIGSVLDPDHVDDLGRPATVLFSQQIAAGTGADAHGFSGSPVLVNGRVIGHLKRIVGDPDSPTRAAFGTIYGTHSAAVASLLGIPLGVQHVVPPPVRELRDLLPALREGERHVLVCYRMADRAFALELASRLEEAGITTLLDQHEALPDPEASLAFSRRVATCRSAVVIVSAVGMASGGYDDEAEVLVRRVLGDPAFLVIPVRLGEAALPLAWRGHAPPQFADDAAPAGPEMVRLLWRLVAHMPPTTSPDFQINQSLQQATELVLASIRLAAKDSPERVYQIWRGWRQAGPRDSSVHLLVAEKLIGAGQPGRALEVLQTGEPGLRSQQLTALALKRQGHHDESLEVLERLSSAGAHDAETSGLLAAAYKTKWERTGQRGPLLRAYDLYDETYQRTQDTWNGINAAALALVLRRHDESAATARRVIEQLAPSRELTHFEAATRAEAFLLLGNVDEAGRWYRKAVALDPSLFQDIALMRRQARRHLSLLELPADALDSSLPVPGVVAFAGHAFDMNRPTARLPAGKLGSLRRAVREALDALDGGFGFSSAAAGSDLVFVEAIVARGGHAYVYLPFARAAFLQTSVGTASEASFTTLLDDPHVTVTELTAVPADPEAAAREYRACNDRIREEAAQYAESLDGMPTLLAVWDGGADRPIGGTGDAVQRWQEGGGAVRIIDPAALR
jgi:tetratricopeptide (TPR) repeat protein